MLRIKVVVVLAFQMSAKLQTCKALRFIIEDKVRNEHSLYTFVHQKAKSMSIYTAKSQSVFNLTSSFNWLSFFSSCFVQGGMQPNTMLIYLSVCFHNTCLRTLLHVYWPETISNTGHQTTRMRHLHQHEKGKCK